MEILERLVAIRKYRNLSQSEVSEWYNIRQTSWGKKERGEMAGFSLEDIQLFLEKTQIDARWLFGQLDCELFEADLKLRKFKGDNEEIAQLLDEFRAMKLKKADTDPLAHRVTIDNNLRSIVEKINKIDRKYYKKLDTAIDMVVMMCSDEEDKKENVG